MIGQLQNEPVARTFSDYLYVQGIENQVEAEKDGKWGIWVHADEELAKAGEMLEGYLKNPADPRFLKSAQEARKRREQEAQAKDEFRKRFRDRSQVFPALAGTGLGSATLVFVVLSVIVYLLQSYERTKPLTDWLFISDYVLVGGGRYKLSGLIEIMHGQVWRLFTPIFLHFGIWHILFNMLCLKDLAGLVEGRQGSLFLVLMVLAIAAVSNVGQYLVSGPDFGGMSGVVYGLCGYVWMRGKCDPHFGLFLHPTTVTMMLIWYFLCLAGWLPHIANTVHTVGLLMGMAWGYWAGVARR